MKVKIGSFQFGFTKKGIKRDFGDGYQKGFERGRANAKYDAAQTNHTSQRYWANADNLSADEANSPDVRRILRMRSRYERSNNSYIKALIEQYGNDVVGTGGRLNFKDLDPLVVEQVTAAWNIWAKEVGLTDHVKILFETKVGDGEGFLIEVSGENEFSKVQLDYIALDPERCSNGPNGSGIIKDKDIDGVKLNAIGKPLAYEFLNRHPGSVNSFNTIQNTSKIVPKSQVIHFFKQTRPEQHRGVPEITSALPLGSKMRSFTLSTVDAAHVASMFSGVLHTQADEYSDELTTGGQQSDDSYQPFDTFALENGMFLTLPQGYDMRQVKAEHPTTTYPEFKKAIVAEMARSVLMPQNVASGDSSDMNFASMKGDRLSWNTVLRICQEQLDRKVMFKIFMTWWSEAILREGVLPNKVRRINYVPVFEWFWDGDTTIDPQKEAKATSTNLASGSTTHATVYARTGKNWKDEYKQLAAEKTERETLGLTIEDFGAENDALNEIVEASVEQFMEAHFDDRKINV